MRGIVASRFEELAKLIGVDSNMALVGSSFDTSKPKPASLTCTPDIIGDQHSYVLRDISVPGMIDSTPLAIIKHDGLVIGGTLLDIRE
jgi:hypothetical protein